MQLLPTLLVERAAGLVRAFPVQMSEPELDCSVRGVGCLTEIQVPGQPGSLSVQLSSCQLLVSGSPVRSQVALGIQTHVFIAEPTLQGTARLSPNSSKSLWNGQGAGPPIGSDSAICPRSRDGSAEITQVRDRLLCLTFLLAV